MPVSNNTNSEFNNTSSEVMNTSPARRSSRQLFESMGDPFKKATLRVIDISRSNKAKINTQNQLIEGLEKEQTETKASLVAMEQENAKMAQELEEIKKSMLSQESLDSYEDKITKFEADIDKLTQELTSKNMYAEQLEASNSALKTQLDQQKSEFNADKASEHRQELNKKNEDIKALQAMLKEMEDKNTQLQEKNAQLQEEVTRLDEENMVLTINKELDEESDSDDGSTDVEGTDDESTDNESTDDEEDANNERVKQLEKRIEQCLAEENVAENLNKENAIKNNALEERVVALQKEINTLKAKYDAVCEQQQKQVKERRDIGLTPSPSPSCIDSTPTRRISYSSPESNVEDLLPGPSFRCSSNTSRSIKSSSSTAGQSSTISPRSLNRGLNIKTTGPSVPRTSPAVGFNGLFIPPSTFSKPITTSATNRTALKPKGLKPSSKLLKFANSKNPSKYITSAANVIPLSSIPKAQASIPSSPPNSKNTTGASLSTGSPPNNKSNTEAESYHSLPRDQLQRLNNSSIDITLLGQVSTNLHSKKRNSSTDVQDKPTADSQETKKRRIEYPVSTIIDQMIKSRKINEVDNADFKDIDKCITEISECYRRMKSIPCPEISDINSFGIPGEFIINAPSRWDKREKSYAWYLSLLSRKKEFYDYILNRIVIAFRAELRTKKMESYNARWMRLICMVLKSKNEMRQMMVILRELACRKNCQYHLFISVVNLIVGWKECVVDPCHDQIQSQTLQVCIAYIAKSNKTPTNAALIYSRIAPLVNWPTLETAITMESLVDSDMRVIMEGLPTYKSSGNEDSFMRARALAVRSLEMVFTSIDNWKSTFDEFLLTRVQPLIPDPVIGEVAVELLGTLGRLGVSDDVFVEDKQGVDTLLNILRQYLDYKATTDAEKSLVKFAALGCLKLGDRDPRCRAIVEANKL